MADRHDSPPPCPATTTGTSLVDCSSGPPNPFHRDSATPAEVGPSEPMQYQEPPTLRTLGAEETRSVPHPSRPPALGDTRIDSTLSPETGMASMTDNQEVPRTLRITTLGPTEEEIWSSVMGKRDSSPSSALFHVTFDADPFNPACEPAPPSTTSFIPPVDGTASSSPVSSPGATPDSLQAAWDALVAHDGMALPILPFPTLPADVLVPLLDWILCACILNFDLDAGQAIESCHPAIRFSEREAKQIAFASFPDSNSAGHVGDTAFSFRIRHGEALGALATKFLPRLARMRVALPSASPSDPPTQRPVPCVEEDGYTYGYAFFRQKPDPSLKRGFFQVYEGVRMVAISGPGVGSSTPLSASGPPGGESGSGAATGPMDILSPPSLCHPACLYELFATSLDAMWACWELMVMGEPVLVMADTPKGCSQVVLGLVELIKPFPFGGDYRPYFTIQDPDFRAFAGANGPGGSAAMSGGGGGRIPRSAPHGMVLGVTNQMLESVLEHWPNIVQVGRLGPETPSQVHGLATNCSPRSPSCRSGLKPQRTKSEDPDALRPASPLSVPSRRAHPNRAVVVEEEVEESSQHQHQHQRTGTTTEGIVHFLTKAASVAACIQSVKLRTHRPFMSRDRELLREVVEASFLGRPVYQLNNLIRNHFIELTTRFAQPLNRYFEGLVEGNPALMSLSTLQRCPRIQPFQFDAFSRLLHSSPPTLPVAGKRPLHGLYAAFCKSCNFASWLRERTMQVHRQWKSRYYEVLCDADLDVWTGRMLGAQREAECVELLLQLREEVAKCAGYFVVEQDNHILSYLKPWRTEQVPTFRLPSPLSHPMVQPQEREAFLPLHLKALRTPPPDARPDPMCTLLPTCAQYYRLMLQADCIQRALSRNALTLVS